MLTGLAVARDACECNRCARFGFGTHLSRKARARHVIEYGRYSPPEVELLPLNDRFELVGADDAMEPDDATLEHVLVLNDLVLDSADRGGPEADWLNAGDDNNEDDGDFEEGDGQQPDEEHDGYPNNDGQQPQAGVGVNPIIAVPLGSDARSAVQAFSRHLLDGHIDKGESAATGLRAVAAVKENLGAFIDPAVRTYHYSARTFDPPHLPSVHSNRYCHTCLRLWRNSPDSLATRELHGRKLLSSNCVPQSLSGYGVV